MNDSHTQTGTSNGVVSGDWLAALTKTAEDKEHAAALVMLDDLRAALAYIEELERNYGAEMTRADTACFALEQIRDNAKQAYAHRVSAPSVIAMCDEGLGTSSANNLLGQSHELPQRQS